MFSQDLRDRINVPRLDIGQYKVIACCKADFRLESLHDGSQRGFGAVRFGVLNAPSFNEETEELPAIRLRVPAKRIALARELIRAGGLHAEVCAAFQFSTEPVGAAFGHDIFQPGVFAIGSVPEVAVNRDRRKDHFLQLLRRDEADDVGQPREGRFIPVAAAHAAADGKIVAEDLAALDYCDQPHVVGKDIGVVHWRNGKADFEFSRQVSLAINRVGKVIAQAEFLAIEPDAVVGRSHRREELRELVRLGHQLRADRAFAG